MSENNYFQRYFSVISDCLAEEAGPILEAVADEIVVTANGGGKVILVGNGGSAAMASHVAVDLTKAAGIRAINFNEADLITCFSNDYGYEKWVEKAVDFYADKNDVLVLISSSGKSLNMINACKAAKNKKKIGPVD